MLDSCTQILEGGPYDIATSMDGRVGLKLMQEFRPDAVFIDLKMPGISGFEVLKTLRELDPTIVPVVITGYATLNSAVEAIKNGAYDFLPKPFTPDEFRTITQRALERRGLVLEAAALAREKEMLREHFAAIVSHELKSPLAAVQQNLAALSYELRDQLSAEQRQRLDQLKGSIDRLIKLIHTWLRVFSTDIQQIRESFQPVAIPSIITKAIESVQPLATRKDIEIVTSINEPLPPVHGHEVTLVEAVVNLLHNAIKYSRPGSQVFVKAEQKDGRVLLSVTDRGVGIAEEDLPFIFSDFYVGKTNQVTERGSGLGLAITRRIVEAHEGKISVDSVLGKGSSFVIDLPALEGNVQEQPAESVGISANPQAQGGLR